MKITAQELFDLDHTKHAELFEGLEYPWQAILRLKEYIADNSSGDKSGAQIHETAIVDDRVTLGKGTVVGPNTVIQGPAIIGEYCKIRPGAYIRGNIITGDNCVIGNSCEVKHAWLFDNVAVPHYNYVGDSILGYKAHFGGGACTANKKGDGSSIVIIIDGERIDTGMNKLGALIGDHAELGANAQLNPGTIVGKSTTIYPGARVRGVLPKDSILKVRQTQELVQKQ